MRGRAILASAFGALAVAAWACSSSYSGDDTDAGVEAGVDDGAPGDSGCSCSDPACGCTAVPNGWFAVAITSEDAGIGDAAPPSCPAYWIEPRVRIEAPHDPTGTCTCACGKTTDNPCLYPDAGKTIDVLFRKTDGGCDTVQKVAVDGECHDKPSSWGTVTGGLGTPIAPHDVACSATPVFAPMAFDLGVSLCTSPAPQLCADGTCVPTPTGVEVCLLHDGDQACPADHPTKHLVVDPSAIDDQRSCGCNCVALATSCKGKVDFWPDQNGMVACPGGSVAGAALDGVTCDNVPGSGQSNYKYVAAPNTDACGSLDGDASAPVDGGFAAPVETLCCPP